LESAKKRKKRRETILEKFPLSSPWSDLIHIKAGVGLVYPGFGLYGTR
jgi:hypothetical protein